MKKYLNKTKAVKLIILVMVLICCYPDIVVKAESVKENGEWRKEGTNWFYADKNGSMKTGWIWSGGYWYFLNPDMKCDYGKMMTGWQWIDGQCYYLAVKSGINYPLGAMYVNGFTPDGYSVDAAGAWTDAKGPVHIPGKGIMTAVSQKTAAGKRITSRGSGRRRNHIMQNKETKKPADPSIPLQEESEEETKKPEADKEQYKYTIRYMDISNKTILQVKTGFGTDGDTIAIKMPEIQGYEPCKVQKKSFDLSSDDMVITIYYSKDSPAVSEATVSEAASSQATPAQARKVSWNLYFVEQGNHSNEILKSQHGKTEEGTMLVVDFPEIVSGTDCYFYYSLVSRPWSIAVSGNGIQKYYIEFKKGDKFPEKAGPEQEAKDKLNAWLEVSKAADYEITGERPSDQQVITESMEESRERMLNLLSKASSAGRKELYLIAKGHIPNTVLLSQTVIDIKNISELVMDEFTIAADSYTILRVGFERIYNAENCIHDYKVIDRVDSACTENGYETVRCRKCGKEETMILPAAGHTDMDHDGICDHCYKPMGEVPKPVHSNIGDIQIRTIGDRIYLFRCIDDDYADAMDNTRRMALFLCDSVIRSDIDGTSKKLRFGSNNNYKYSHTREWLHNNAADNLSVPAVYIGITRSYIGATGKGAFDQLNDNSLMGFNRMFQSMEDTVFILSVEEALKYREYLWKFDGSHTNNPESQISAYSKGYYLRTPQDSGIDDFRYGTGIYAVDLVNGNIQPVDVTDTSTGIRPVMVIPQG